MTHTSPKLAITVALTFALLGCSKTDTPIDTTAAPAATTAPSGEQSKESSDLARIRELAEKEDAEREAQKKKSNDLGRQIQEGLKEPAKVRTF